MKEIKLINDGWFFVRDFDGVPEAIPEGAVPTELPHTWNAEDGTDGGNDYFRGKCLYMRPLSQDEIARGDKYYLEFRGVNSTAEVFVDGTRVISHEGGYSTFRADITEYIKKENLIAAVVDNSHSDEIYPAMADFTFYGGIYRDVYLISVPSSHFELDCYGSGGIKITSTVGGRDAEVDIEVYVTEASRELTLKYKIIDALGKCVSESETDAKTNRQSFKISSPHLWQGVDDPYLYTAEVSLFRGEECLDRVRERFGIRTFSADAERGFILNGKPYPLRGVSRHQDREGRGNALLPRHHEDDVRLISELGANTVRLAHYQHDRYFYDLCDERGLVVWAEIPYISKHSEKASENAATQLKELILQNYNHPSICFWGLSNEITMSGADEEQITESHKKLNDLAHTLDPTRLTGIAAVSMCPKDHPYLKIPDVVGYNHYFGWYGGDTSMNGPWFDSFHAEHPNIPVAVTEYGCEALDWHTSDPKQGDYTEEYQAFYHEELIKQLFSRSYIFATWVWNMFDFGADARAEGGEHGQNHKGLVTFDRLYKKDAFYAYKANLSREPFVHIAGKRYKERAENSTRVTVYSNLPEVELFANGISLGKRSDPYGFFKFDVPLSEYTVIKAVAGELSDTAVLLKTEKPNEKYILKEKGAVLNWFDVTAPEGYFSLNDTISDIMSTVKGNLWFAGFWSKFAKKLDTGMPVDGGMMKMLGGFTVLRFVNTLGAMAEPMTKDELLEINAKLNKIKKPQ